MKKVIRKFYKDLVIGQEVEVQVFYGRLTDNHYVGIVSNMDGQNIVVEIKNHIINEPIVDGDEIKLREFEACNPEYAIVQNYYPEEF